MIYSKLLQDSIHECFFIPYRLENTENTIMSDGCISFEFRTLMETESSWSSYLAHFCKSNVMWRISIPGFNTDFLLFISHWLNPSNDFNLVISLPGDFQHLTVLVHQQALVLTTRWRHQMETFSALLALCEGNHRSPVDSPHKGQWRGALMFSLICAWSTAKQTIEKPVIWDDIALVMTSL